jgi:hypothetical protein
MPLKEYTGEVVRASVPSGLKAYTGEVVRPSDNQSGAPANVRASVGAARTPLDRLATLRKTYPDAQPIEDDNFVFTDPKTKLATRYNPKGFDVGDIASIGGEASEMFGGILGGAAAVPPAIAATPATLGGSLLAIPAGIGLGAAGARELFDRSMSKLGGTVDTRNLPTRITDSAVTAGTNAIGARLGDLVAQGGRALIAPVQRYARNLAPGRAAQDAALLGVTPTAGMVTGNRAVQTAEQALLNMPGGAGPMQEAAETALAQMDAAAQRVAAGYGRAQTQQGAGGTMRAAATNSAERFAARRQDLDNQLGQIIGDDTPVMTANVGNLARQLEQELANAPESRQRILGGTLNQARSILQDAGNNGLRFRTLRSIRTDLGRELERPDVSGYTPATEAAARRLYGAISEDIGAAADAAGPAARRALTTHDRYVRFNREINLPTLQKIADAQTDEHAFNIAMNAAKDGGTMLTRLRRNYAPAE